MLYLEDFLELIENLPSELRDRFTEIRTLDLEVQNGLDRADQNVEEFFKNAPSLNADEQQRCFDKIKDDYRKILENADEKVNLATMMHDLVKRYLARLDQEVNKFKIELEADSPGITEMLEKNVKEAEQTSRVYKKQRHHKRKRTSAAGATAALVNGNGPVGHTEWAHNASMDTSSPVGGVVTGGGGGGFENIKSSVHPNVHAAIASASHFKKSQSYPNRMGEMRTLTINGQQMAVREKGSSTHSQASGSFLHSFTEHTESRHGRPRKLTSRVSEMLRDVIQKQEQRERLGSDASSSSMAGAAMTVAQNYYHHQQQQQQQIQSGHHYHHGHQGGGHGSSSSSSALNSSIKGGAGNITAATSTDSDPDLAGNDSAELSDQSDQQRWCICNRVSFGAMVACDDKDCPFEWFHYECVGITQPPKGKWFCPHCTKRRK